MSDTASLNEQNAANYIKDYFLLSTGVQIPVVTETQFSSNKTERFISVGYTTLAENRGITLDNYDLGFSGYAIKTINGNTYVVSGNKASIVGAVFGYLNRELGVEVYAQDCYSYTENDSSYVLSGIDEVFIPDMDIATVDMTYATANGLHYKMGYVARAENIFSVSASAHQTMWTYIPLDTHTAGGNTYQGYTNTHPKWYNKYATGWWEGEYVSVSDYVNGIDGHNLSDDEKTILINAYNATIDKGNYSYIEKYQLKKAYKGSVTEGKDLTDDEILILKNAYKQKFPTQVCFNANGDAAELELMKQEFLTRMKWGLKRWPTSYIFIFGMEDNADRCDCTNCTEMKAKYGVDNAASVIFANSVAEMMKAWMETPEGLPYKKDFKILIDAYEADIKAPVKYNETTGKYEPIDELVVCNENVSVFFAPAHMDFKRSIFDDVNRETYEAFEGWKVCSPHGISLYLYQTNYRSPLFFFDTYTNMKELYQYLATGNIEFVHNSGSGYNPVTPGFEVVTTYIQSLLVKDVETDVDAATERFFDNYYGVASTAMKDYFNSYITWCKHLDEDGIYKTDEAGTYMWETMHREFTYWDDGDYSSLEILDEWKGYTDAALTAISTALSDGTIDSDTYDTLYKRIILERIPIFYVAAEIDATDINYVGLDGMTVTECRQMIKADCERLGITSNGYYGAMAELYAKWGIA